MNQGNDPETLREQEYQRRVEANRLRREMYEQTNLMASHRLLQKLQEVEEELSRLEQQRATAEAKDRQSGLVLDTERASELLGAETTGIEAEIYLRVAHVPTAISHLMDQNQHPLITCIVRNVSQNTTRRLRITSSIEGFSTHAVDTVELKAPNEHKFNQLPMLLPDRVQSLNELTRATLNIMLEDLDGRVELHKTQPIWLLAKTTAPLAVRDPKTGKLLDLTPYFGAFVTPNTPSIMRFLGTVAEHHPDRSLLGYQASPTAEPAEKAAMVEAQVRAIFNALKDKANIRYVNSFVAFSPEEGTATQRVRLPSESLEHGEANCVDGTVLFASLLEAISLSPAIVVVPGHAFVAWETWLGSGEWKYLETTAIQSHYFEDACALAEATAKHYKTQADKTKYEANFRLWPLRVLRSKVGITPME